MSKNQEIVQDYICDSHNDRIKRQHLRPGYPDKESPEHNTHENKEKAINPPVQETDRRLPYLIRRDQQAHHVAREPPGKGKKQKCHQQEKNSPLCHHRTNLPIIPLPIASGNQDLRTGTETKSDREDTNIIETTHSGSAQLNLADTPQKGRIRHVYDILGQKPQENRVSHPPNRLIVIHHRLFHNISNFRKY